MSIFKVVFLVFAIVLLLLGFITMVTGQFYLLNKIGKWNLTKAYMGVIPFFLFIFLKFDNQVKTICRNYPVYISYLKNGSIITLTGTVVLLLTIYLW